MLPRWTDWWDEADIAPMFSDPTMRQKVIAEQPTLPLAYYEQRIPVPDDWDDHSCSYLLFGPRTTTWPPTPANAAGGPHICPARTSTRSSTPPAPPGNSSNSPPVKPDSYDTPTACSTASPISSRLRRHF